MPAQYFRNLTGKHRSATANRQLGFSLAFVAAAADDRPENRHSGGGTEVGSIII